MSYKDDLPIKIALSNSCDLVALQYEAILEHIDSLKNCILTKNKEQGFKNLDKIRDILANLMVSLKTEESDFKEKTIELYLYSNQMLNESYLKEDVTLLNPIIKNFTTLRDAWMYASKNTKSTEAENISNAITYGKNDVNITGSSKDFGRG